MKDGNKVLAREIMTQVRKHKQYSKQSDTDSQSYPRLLLVK